MSRTDKTAPYFVKKMWIPREVHDHRFGDCTLPDAPDGQYVYWSDRTRCYWDTNWYDPIYRCGCGMCGYENRQTNRNRRHDHKAAIKAGRYDDIPSLDFPMSHYCW